MSQADAFASGSAAASTATTFGGINATKGAETIPKYSTSNPSESYFAGGLGDTITPGSNKRANCLNGPAQSGTSEAEECNAIKYLSSLPGNTPALGLTRADPLFVKGKAIANDPESLADNLGKNYSACTAQTTVNPGNTTYEICNDYLATGTSTCDVTRDITVAVDRVYQCVDSKAKLTTSTCNRTLGVTVTAVKTCNQGAWMGTTGGDPCGMNGYAVNHGAGSCGRWAGVYVQAYCNQNATTQTVYLSASCTESPCSGAASFTFNNNGSTGSINFGGFQGRSWYWSDWFTNVVFAGGSCNATTCSATIQILCGPGNTSCYWNTVMVSRTVTWAKPVYTYAEADTWTNGCSALQALAQ